MIFVPRRGVMCLFAFRRDLTMVEVDMSASIFIRYSFKVAAQSSPSIAASGAAGILLISIAALPFINSRESLEVAWLQHSLSSLPVCLASAWASCFTCSSAVLCQPPKDSKARGMNATPCLAQSSPAPLIFLSKATVRLWPGVTAASATVAFWSGFITVTSSAASRPSAQLGMKISAGLLSTPGKMKRPSFTGFRTALAAMLWTWSRIALCLVILSPHCPQHKAWSPKRSLC